MLFSGMACFSPSVPALLRKGWVKNGGTLTHSAADFYQTNFFFCSGLGDPWLSKLLSRSLVVRHAKWISTCISEQFLMPVAPYTLDDHFDPTAMDLPEITLTNSEIITATGTALNSTSTTSQPVDAQTNPLKRQFQAVTADDSYPEINPRAAKKPRARTDNSLPLEHSRTLSKRSNKETRVEDAKIHQPESIDVPQLPARSPRSRKSAPSNAPSNSHRYSLARFFTAQSRVPSRASAQPRSIDHATIGPSKSPRRPRKYMPSNRLEDTHPSTASPPTNRPRKLSKKPSSFIIKPLKAPVEPVAKPTATEPSESTSAGVELEPLESQSNLAEKDTRTLFWKGAREGYSGSGALVLSMADILQASKPSIEAKLFSPNGNYYGEDFGCSWRS